MLVTGLLIANLLLASCSLLESFLDGEAKVLERFYAGDFMHETSELLRQSVRFGYINVLESIALRWDFDPMLDSGAYLQIAVIRGRNEIVEMVLEYDHRLAQNVLLWASRCGNEGLVKHVLDLPYVADPSASDNAALRSAALGGHHSIVKRLLRDYRVDPNCNGNVCLLSACNDGNTLVAIALLDDPRTKYLDLPLKVSARKGHTEIVRRLLRRRDASPSVLQNDALKQASKQGHLEIVKMLLSDSRVQPNWECFYRAAIEGHSDIVEAYLEDRRVDPSGVLSRVLIDCCSIGHTKIVDLLLTDGRADPRDMLGRALQKSVKNGHTEIVKLLLLDGRIDPGQYGQSAFSMACLHGHRDVAEALLSDPRVDPSEDCANLLKIASQFGQVDVTELLLNHERVLIEQNGIEDAFNTALKAGHGKSIALYADRFASHQLRLKDDWPAPASTRSIARHKSSKKEPSISSLPWHPCPSNIHNV